MVTSDVSACLRAVRRLRRGTLDAGQAPVVLQTWLRDGLGYTCDRLARWVEATVSDPRSVDAVIRFYGLDRLPEELSEIGRTLPRQAPFHGLVPPETPAGVTTRQVQNILGSAIDEMENPFLVSPVGQDGQSSAQLADPFPGLWRPAEASRLRALWWAWAQIPDHQTVAKHALLFYEYEHGLRSTCPSPRSRTERQRWRRLAWSVLDVASYRLDRARSVTSEPVSRMVERSLGPRLIAAVAGDSRSGEGIDALLLLQSITAALISLDAVEASLGLVRQAVRLGEPAAPELFGMLRDVVSRRAEAKGARSVPPEVTSKLFTLSTILARERRDPSAIPAAQWALDWGEQWLSGATSGEERGAVLSDTLRTAQELAELFDALGIYSQAWLSLRRMRGLLQDFGDPEQEIEPGGWLQQFLLTSSSVSRHLARGSRRAAEWLRRSSVEADRSADLVFDTQALPMPWGVSAQNQRVNGWLDVVDLGTREGWTGVGQVLERATGMVEELLAEQDLWTNADARPVRSARLGLQLTSWRAAVLSGDAERVAEIRSVVWSAVDSLVLPRDRDKVVRFELASVTGGLVPPEEARELPAPAIVDRGLLRPAHW